MKSMSPLLRSLLVLNLIATFLILTASLWPLPGQASRPLTNSFGNIEAHQNDVSAVDVSEVLNRPLFHENRRKPAKMVAKAEQAAPVRKQLVQPFILAGILGNSAGERTVYLLNKQTQETVSAKEGGQAGIWEVKKIDQSRVTLQSGNTVRILDMSNRN